MGITRTFKITTAKALTQWLLIQLSEARPRYQCTSVNVPDDSNARPGLRTALITMKVSSHLCAHACVFEHLSMSLFFSIGGNV